MKPEEKAVIDSNNAVDSYRYCLNNEDANINLHEDIIIKSENPSYITSFAENIKGANIKKLEEAIIIKKNNAFYIYAFARYIEGANINKLEEAIIKANFLEYGFVPFGKVKTSLSLRDIKEISCPTKDEYTLIKTLL